MIKVNEDFAYWVGVVQTDGSYFTGLVNKRRKTPSVGHHVNLEVSLDSYQMLEKFLQISRDILGSKANIWYRQRTINGKKWDVYGTCLGIKSIVKDLDVFGINLHYAEPPKVFNDKKLFGAYLAGIIDGDGSVNVRKDKNKKRPYCAINIVSHEPIIKLNNLIKGKMNCSSSYSKVRDVNAFTLRFSVTHKNKEFIMDYMLHHMAISRKRNKLRHFMMDFLDREDLIDLYPFH